jgi:hypothetical protein
MAIANVAASAMQADFMKRLLGGFRVQYSSSGATIKLYVGPNLIAKQTLFKGETYDPLFAVL